MKLESSRVWRSFLGGKLLEEWRGVKPGQDTHLPEDWLGSTVKARNIGREEMTDEGYSFVTDASNGKTQRTRLKDLIESDPAGLLGAAHVERHGTGSAVLVKLVDSAQRLTLQVHPTEADARRHFNFPYGKTEAWYILQTRRINGVEPYIMLGFKEGVTRADWLDVYQKQDIPRMLGLMHRVPVSPGDMVYIPSGMAHGMGDGVLFVEIQEPCDITIRTEKTTPTGKPLSDEICSCGIGVEAMMDLFDYTGYSYPGLLERYLIRPRTIAHGDGYFIKNLIGPPVTDRFSLYRLACRDAACRFETGGYFVLLVDKGSGFLVSPQGRTRLEQGETYFVPASVREITWESAQGMDLLLACPPL
jgi:mannose-6-phosphate isomerase